ncbi:ankyrin, partial [Anaeromyces robustus]
VKYLVEHGADVNKQSNDSTTPLFYACINGHENIVKYLVEHGADVNKKNNDGKIPL